MKAHYQHLFIDARSIMVPAFYAGQEFSALQALLSVVASTIAELRPKTVCVVFGDTVSKSKKEFYPKYGSIRSLKRTDRDKKALQREIELARYFLSRCPVRQVSPIGIETKDAIAYLTQILQRPKVIVSSNQDYFQILRPDLQILDPREGLFISEYEAEIILGFPSKYYLLWKSIVGDAGYSTPGIKRIGRERAMRLIKHTIKTGQKFPLNPSEQRILDRNKYLFSVGEVLTKEEKQEVLELYQSERIKPNLGDFTDHHPSSFGIETEIQEIFRLSKETRPLKTKPEGVTLQ